MATLTFQPDVATALRDAVHSLDNPFPWNGAEVEDAGAGGAGFQISIAAVPAPVEPFYGPWQFAWIHDANGDGPSLDTFGPYLVQLLDVDTNVIAEQVCDTPDTAIAAVARMWSAQWGDTAVRHQR